MISPDQKAQAYEALRAAGFPPPMARELLSGPKTIRDEFAGQALNGLVTRADLTDAKLTPAAIAELAYTLAEAMMTYRASREFPGKDAS